MTGRRRRPVPDEVAARIADVHEAYLTAKRAADELREARDVLIAELREQGYSAAGLGRAVVTAGEPMHYTHVTRIAAVAQARAAGRADARTSTVWRHDRPDTT